MHKFVILFAIVAAVVLAEEEYTNKFDNVNIDEILQSDRLILNYCKCLSGKKTTGCPPEVAELKRILPDALETGCAKCRPAQKVNAKKVIAFLVNEKPDCWSELAAIHDPTGKYAEQFKTDYEAIKH